LTLHDAEVEEKTRRLLVGMGSVQSNENRLVLYDKDLLSLYSFDFRPDSPFPHIHQDLKLNSLRWVEHQGKRYVVAIFLGARFPTAAVILDDQLREVGRLWHPGHLYGVTSLNGRLYFWGMNNTFLRNREKFVPEKGIDPMTINHLAIMAIDLDSLRGGPWMGPRGQRLPPPALSIRETPRASFVFYYLVDTLTNIFIGPMLEAKPNDQRVVFTSHELWRYSFSPNGVLGDPQPLPLHSQVAAGLIGVLPKDETGELLPESAPGATPIGTTRKSGSPATRDTP
jgi:hypothetical protein